MNKVLSRLPPTKALYSWTECDNTIATDDANKHMNILNKHTHNSPLYFVQAFYTKEK